MIGTSHTNGISNAYTRIYVPHATGTSLGWAISIATREGGVSEANTPVCRTLQDTIILPATQEAYLTAQQQALAHAQSVCSLDLYSPSHQQQHTTVTTTAASGLSTRIVGNPFGSSLAHGDRERGGVCGGGGGGGEWAVVEVAAQRVLMLYGKVRARLASLESQARCRHR